MARFLPEMGQSRIPPINRSESDHVTGQKTGRTTLFTSRLSGYQSDSDVSADKDSSSPARGTGASAGGYGVFWLDQEEQ
jgi:hypothetical protein